MRNTLCDLYLVSVNLPGRYTLSMSLKEVQRQRDNFSSTLEAEIEMRKLEIKALEKLRLTEDCINKKESFSESDIYASGFLSSAKKGISQYDKESTEYTLMQGALLDKEFINKAIDFCLKNNHVLIITGRQ